MSIKVVKLPYVIENPLKIYKYLENTNDITLRAIAPNIAPGIWLLKVTLCFGINLYNNKNTINVARIKPISVNTCRNILIKGKISKMKN